MPTVPRTGFTAALRRGAGGWRRVATVVTAAGLAVTTVQALPARAATPAAITVGSSVVGRTPDVLGYNTAHAMAGSNTADWWRYSGVKAARVFLSASDIEASDDIGQLGDGVSDRSSFEARRLALRTNAASSSPLDPAYVNWSAFTGAYTSTATGNNRFAVASWFPTMRAMGIDILANITASPSRFPLAGVTDYPNLWELWQHYYAQAFLLSRDYDVARFSMFNEPNGWTPAITVEDWGLRLRVASDAIQSAVADMNSRYGRSLTVAVLAPNTANGATKYDDYSTGDYWGDLAITQRNQNIWGEPATSASYRNLHVYNYQKYTTSASDYATDYDALRAELAADLPSEPAPPLALTEYNVRTGLNYDGRVETADSPSDYAALGANSVTLAERGASQLYLFKFGMTERTGGTYPVAKNGTHYVQNATTGVNNYGGAAGTAEVYRLFVRASGSARERLAVTSTLGAGVFVQATRESAGGPLHVFVANTNTTAASVDLDVSALGVADGSLATTSEVSTTARGAVVRSGTVTGGRLAAASMPAQSVWLISLYPGIGSTTTVTATADAALGDGSGRNATGGTATQLVARADGTTAGRKVAVLRFPVPTTWTPGQRVLLSLSASTTTGTTPVQAHLYGLATDTWTESSVTFASLTGALLQNVGAGSVIANNVVKGQGTTTRMLGQVMANSTTASTKLVDVTDFVTAQTDGFASFLLVQDHRWDVKLPEKTNGDVQPAGIRVASKETASAPALRIVGAGTPATTTTVAPTTTTTPPTTTTSTTTPSTSTTTSTTTTTPGATTITAEFESLTVSGSSGDSVGIKSDTQASGGKSVLFRANAVGDYIVFRLNVPTAGSYNVAMTAKMQSDRGIIQLAVGDSPTGPFVNVDTPKDEYRSALTFGSVGTFTAKATFASSGTKYIRLSVTGRNGAASGYYVSADKLTLTP